MNKTEKAIFWIGLIIIAIDDIYWQWAVKLTTDPITGGNTYRGWSMLADIVLLVVWIKVVLKIYKKANRKD